MTEKFPLKMENLKTGATIEPTSQLIDIPIKFFKWLMCERKTDYSPLQF